MIQPDSYLLIVSANVFVSKGFNRHQLTGIFIRYGRAVPAIAAAVISIFLVSRPILTHAAAVYTNETDFVNALGGSQQFLNDFNDLTEQLWDVHPLQYASNGFAYYITSIPNLHVFSQVGLVSTVYSNDTLVINFSGNNVRAAGGWIYVIDTNAVPVDGSVIVTLNDGTTNTIASSAGAPAFTGFISAGTVLTNILIQGITTGASPALDHFYVAEGQPSFSTSLVTTDALVLSWPVPSTGYVLESATSLTDTNWTTVSTPPQTVNGQEQVIIPLTGTSSFYRLIKQ